MRGGGGGVIGTRCKHGQRKECRPSWPENGWHEHRRLKYHEPSLTENAYPADMPTVPELPYLSLKKRMERESP